VLNSFDANAQLLGNKYSFSSGSSPISIEFGTKYNFHYNFETDSILTPPRMIFVGAQIGYVMDGWLKPYVELNASVSAITGRSFFGGINIFIVKKTLSRSSKAFFNSLWLSLNVDYGYISIAPPVAPSAYVSDEWIFRFGGSTMILLGKGGKTFIDFTGLLYNQSMSNLMASIGVNFGFLLY
jgi:hypothetical protein